MVSVVMCILEPVTTTTPQQSYIQTVVFFTCDGAIGEDATAVFNMLSGYSEPLSWNELAVAPIWLRTKFTKLIKKKSGQKKQEQSRTGWKKTTMQVKDQRLPE